MLVTEVNETIGDIHQQKGSLPGCDGEAEAKDGNPKVEQPFIARDGVGISVGEYRGVMEK